MLIEGLGPSGLYSAWLAFEAGFDVVGVEKRAEDAYIRARFTQLDIKWTVQLLWLLGTAATKLQTKLGDDSQPPMDTIYEDWAMSGFSLDLFRLEIALRNRLQALAARVRKRAKAERWPAVVTLSLRYRTRFVEVLYPSRSQKRQGYSAVVEETYVGRGKRWAIFSMLPS